MAENNIFYYRKSAGYNVFPGAHIAKSVGNGWLFKHHKPLIAEPDFRRIDLRASVLNPYSQFQIKAFQQASRIDVFLLADLSASMGFQGQYSKSQIVIDCLYSIARSVHAAGDQFGFVGCAQTIDPRLLISPANLQQGRVTEIAGILQAIVFKGQSDSLLQASNYLPERPALVFLLSDFYMPIEIIQQQMQRLNKHMIVPLVLWDKKENSDLPDWGMVKFVDSEQGKTRTLFMRPALRQKIQSAFVQRKQLLRQCFRRFGCEPLFIEQGYRAELISHYFLQYGG